MLRPQMHLIAAGRLYPKAWRQADQFRADRGKGPLQAWPSWCYLPMAAWYAIVSEGNRPPPAHPPGPLERLPRRARTIGNPASLAPADSGQCRGPFRPAGSGTPGRVK